MILPSACQNFQNTGNNFEKRIPQEFQAFYKKNYQEQDIPFAIYVLENEPWKLITQFEIEDEVSTLKHLSIDPEFYKDWASIFFGEETEYLNEQADINTILQLYQGEVLTEKMVYSIVKNVPDWLFLEEELNKIPYRYNF